ncbi:hypothetical protein SBOR_0340 [Sclerotinia borealis F-4128]|uniref:Uncharacterized protein n=1 Tax=Sclerotinia borealis (strain F-4128) TaxID=1432307 RepID=W9CXD7_SCLBF|nr:hypothetical protein SBOR_0340 [Sclerotinia borealis F-4128]
MGKGNFQRRKGKKPGKNYMPGASMRGHLMAKGFNAAATNHESTRETATPDAADILSISGLGQSYSSTEKGMFAHDPTSRSAFEDLGILYLQSPYVLSSISNMLRHESVYLRYFKPAAANSSASKDRRGNIIATSDSSDILVTAIESMFNLSVICRQTYLDIVGGSLLYKLRGFRFTSPEIMAHFFDKIQGSWNLIPDISLEFEVKCGGDFGFVCWAVMLLTSSHNLEKLKLKISVCAVKEEEDLRDHPHNVFNSIVGIKTLWEWIDAGLKRTHRLKDFSVELIGDDSLSSYVKFGGDKEGWYLLRNWDALKHIEHEDMLHLGKMLTKRYPIFSGLTNGWNRDNLFKDDGILLDYKEPVATLEDALDILEEEEEEEEELEAQEDDDAGVDMDS